MNELWKFHPEFEWKKEELDNSPAVRASHEAVVAADKMYAMFGENDDG